MGALASRVFPDEGNTRLSAGGCPHDGRDAAHLVVARRKDCFLLLNRYPTQSGT
jgi:hypothetical protein